MYMICSKDGFLIKHFNQTDGINDADMKAPVELITRSFH